MSWYTSGQNDQNVRYFLLDSAHGSYESKRAIIESLSPNYTLDDGAVANTKVVRGYVTDAEMASNALDIGGCVLDRLHNFINPNAAAVTIRTNSWGDKHPIWGKFLRQPQALPTTPIDRLVQWWKDGSETALYVTQTSRGTGDGSSYANAKSVIGIDTTSADLVVICGRLERFANQSITNFGLKSGSSGSETQWLSHPVDTAQIMGGPKLGSGSGGDGAFSNDTGNRWVSENTTGLGGGAPFEGLKFALYWNGSALVPLTKVADETAVTSTTNSWYAEPLDSTDPGSAGSKLWVNIGGPDPTSVVFWGGYVGGGINFSIASKTYFQIHGIEFNQCTWNGSAQTGASHYAWYGCKFGYAASGVGSVFGCDSGEVNETTGDFTYDQQTDRTWIGCEVYYCCPFLYDRNGGHNRVPLRTVVKYNYFHDMNGVAADAYGISLFSASDQHVAVTQGTDTCDISDNCCERTGNQPFLHYLQPNSFTTPTGGLELTDGFADGFQYPGKCWADSSTTFVYPGRMRVCTINYNLIIDPKIGGSYSTADGQCLALQGDNAQLLDIAGGQYDGNEIAYNIVEGAFNDGAIRLRLAHATESERANVHHNIIRGASVAMRSLMNITVFGGSTYNPSYSFNDNDVHATSRFVDNQNILATNHLFDLDRNTYRNDDGATWNDGADTRTTLADWQAAALTGDTHDPNSTHTALTTDTGSPTLTISGTSLLTSSLGSDPDGATSGLYYQWFKDGELITSAESASYNAAGQTGGFTLVILGTDAKGKAFLVTSNTLTLTDAPIIPSATGGIPLSEDEYYRKLKKNEPPDETVELAPPVPRVVQTGVVTLSRPPVIRSDTALKLALERAEQIARERPKKRNRRKDDDWFILN